MPTNRPDAVKGRQPQLRIYAWLVRHYPHWLHWPEHARMMTSMFWRIVKEEASQ